MNKEDLEAFMKKEGPPKSRGRLSRYQPYLEDIRFLVEKGYGLAQIARCLSWQGVEVHISNLSNWIKAKGFVSKKNQAREKDER